MITRPTQEAFSDSLTAFRERVDAKLATIIAADRSAPERLREAMAYSVLGSGKRIRPLLAYASGQMCGLAPEQVDAIAAAVELVHAYSLVHDDLPAMDDDDLRRGRPTTHRAFDEATAILAGDALQALAFELLCGDPALGVAPDRQIRVINCLAQAAGPSGMVGGQMLDLAAEGRGVDEAALEDIHRRKTGELIRAAIMMPAELAALSADEHARLDHFATDIGLVFQIRDDLLEIEADTRTLGKNAGSDATNDKSTYPSLLGPDVARQRADDVYHAALNSLEHFGSRANGLRQLSAFILKRSY